MQTTIEYDKPEQRRLVVHLPDNESYPDAQTMEVPGGKQQPLDSSEGHVFTLQPNTTDVTFNAYTAEYCGSRFA